MDYHNNQLEKEQRRFVFQALNVSNPKNQLENGSFTYKQIPFLYQKARIATQIVL